MCSDFFFHLFNKRSSKENKNTKKHLHENNLFFKHLELSTRKKFPKKIFLEPSKFLQPTLFSNNTHERKRNRT